MCTRSCLLTHNSMRWLVLRSTVEPITITPVISILNEQFEFVLIVNCRERVCKAILLLNCSRIACMHVRVRMNNVTVANGGFAFTSYLTPIEHDERTSEREKQTFAETNTNRLLN